MLPSHSGIEEFRPVLAPEIPMLAQVLQAHGYTTAAFVNDLQMKAHWGFSRGFGTWREFTEGTPEGTCEHITAQAIQWLDTAPPSPYFMFLHYYDPHDPYDPPAAFRERFGSSLSGAEASRIVRRIHKPDQPAPEPALMQQVIGSYDGEIAWLDHELGKLFARLPADTLVVVFSDHGEAFKEHGWALHGANLYEEELRAVLVMRHPELLPANVAVPEPVMLLDVAPTILALCGIESPANYEGTDLSPLWREARGEGRGARSEKEKRDEERGTKDEKRPPSFLVPPSSSLASRPSSLGARLTLAETKAPFQGRALKMVMLGEWKLIYSITDASYELYRLPDEKTNLAGKEAPMAETLLRLARDWAGQEDYFLLRARGPGEFTVNLLLPQAGQFLNAILVGGETEGEDYDVGPNGRWVRWTCRPEARERTCYVQLVPRDAPVRIDLRIDGVRQPGKIFLGAGRKRVSKLPVDLPGAGSDADLAPGESTRLDGEGLLVTRFRSQGGPGVRVEPGTLDARTIEQLRALGYVR
jgi:hypothetical protein